MEKYAEVIVDVPAMQTDQPFTYGIPEKLAEIIKPGMRVEVPFGNGNRHIQGFVTGLTNQAIAETKDVLRVLDLEPVLNQELLAMADYMKETTFAFKITCLQTMLPSVMKAEYQKKLLLKDFMAVKEAGVEALFDQAGELDWLSAQNSGQLGTLLKLRQAGAISLRYEVHTKNKVKTIRLVTPTLSPEEFVTAKNQLKKTAIRKSQLLTMLEAAAGESLPVKQYTQQGISTNVLNQGAESGWLSFSEVETYRDPFENREFEQTTALALNEDQLVAVTAINEAAQKQEARTFLLEGITGSGKTEVYLQSIAQVIAAGKSAIMLVPEIALTPQMVERFKSRLGDAVAVLHSALSQGERYDEWRKIERGEAKVVVGARSAIFAPLENIGLIIVDEEHEATYKQDETPRYHARDLAIWRGGYHQCPVVLGSATPSLESRARAQKNVYTLLRLRQRANPEASLPSVAIVDMKEEYSHKNPGNFSQVLKEKIADRLANDEQIVLLLNRRGYSSFVMCRDCGHVVDCPNCDISLTLHMDVKRLRCHYCGHEEAILNTCPECGSRKIRYYGTGTQKVQEELQGLFPDAKILRMDVDTTRKKGAHEKILRAFGEKKAQILLGTQMIAKGLDFPDITLVGVLNADTALNLPDFRASERTFQLLTQVSGRAGRAEKAGEVLIQTFNPEHYAIQLAQQQDYEAFYQQEMFIRHQSGYPPYYYTVKITVSHEEEQKAAQKLFLLANELSKQLTPQAIFLGPTPGNVARVKKRYYYQLIIKYKKEPYLQQALEQILVNSQQDQRQGLLVSIDNEPMNFI
ncbi:primosomal protein N' [Enterococcus sp. 2201sp1_2201st1_B8_2201SCRN_220225]|uniref:primosomal protein N' n=1 Tax=unclassified Enterococcus TaxID=2608891 RepID=UPI0034A36986